MSKMPNPRGLGIDVLFMVIATGALAWLIKTWGVTDLPAELQAKFHGDLMMAALVGFAAVLAMILISFIRDRRRCVKDMKRMWSRLPERAKTGDLATDLLLVDPSLGTEAELTPVEPPRGKVVPAISLKLQLACARFCLLRSANFIPAE